MIIKFLLITLLALLAVFVIWQKITSPGVRSTALIILAIGAYFVWQPEHANAVAHSLGVGRGADGNENERERGERICMAQRHPLQQDDPQQRCEAVEG